MVRKTKDKEAGQFMGHIPCPLDGCGSSDAGAYYLHDDGSYSFSCFSCKRGIKNFDGDNQVPLERSTKERYINWEEELEKMEEIRDGLDSIGSKERRIRAEYYEKYGVKMDLEDDGETIKAVYYPTYRGEDHVGYRCRSRFKEGSKAVEKDPSKLGVLKDFSGSIGDCKKGINLFGQHLFQGGGKYSKVIITCGEEDAVATHMITTIQSKTKEGWPTVSTPSGENVGWIKPHLKWLSSFNEIYVIPDKDKAGEAFKEELCKILPVGKVKVVELPNGYKDPCDMTKKATSKDRQFNIYGQFMKCLWDAKPYSPAGIMSLSEGWSNYLNRGKDTLIRFPESFGDLNEKTFGGFALGEVINIIAPSSVGKSSFVKEILYSALESTNYNIGVLSLEETIDEFIEGMLSIHMSEQLNEIPLDMRDRKKEYEAFQELTHLRPQDIEISEEDKEVERIHFLDHQGACSGDKLLDKVDFLVNGLDCKVIVLDPVTLACSGGDTDEDYMASEIVKRTKGKKLAWINVHHVRKNSTSATANSEGADLAEEDIKGTGAWFQTGMINLIFTRNKVHSNPIVRNTTKIKMSKCRRHGKSTGMCGTIYYNGNTGRLELGQDIEELLSEEAADFDDKPVMPDEWD